MSTGIWTAASGAVAQTAALDVAANNVANATTPGFKAETAIFRQTLVAAQRNNAATASQRFAVSRTTSPDFRPGQIINTGRNLDVALTDEKSLFAVATPGGERYTRAGSFRVTTDGTLTTANGLAVLDGNHRPVKLPNGLGPVEIGSDGSINQNGEPTGSTIGVFTFANTSGLEKEGDLLMRARPESGRVQPARVALEVGALEQSNANAVSSMTTLVNASRQFEMVTKVIEAFSQVERRAATDIMK